MKWLRRFDALSGLLLFFIVFLAALFYYLFTVERNISYHGSEQKRLFKLKLLDKELNNFSLHVNQFNNYDDANQKIEEFKTTLLFLKKELNLHYPDNVPLKKELQTIEKSFTKKIENINYFKSLNASLIAGSYFLFDLQSTISEGKNVPDDIKILINETLFYTVRYITNDYIEKSKIQKNLFKITHLSPSLGEGYLKNFYKQALISLDTVASLKEVSLEIQTSPLYQSLTILNASLSKSYNKNLRIQEYIAIAFFITAVIILLLLIKMHLASLQTREELLAFKYAMQHSDNTIVITDVDRRITFANEVFEKTTGYSLKEVLGENPKILKSGLMNESVYLEMNEKLDKGEKWQGEFINKKKDGSIFYEKASIVPVFLDKNLIYYLAIKLDVTHYVEQNAKLAQAASVFENTQESIIITDPEGKVVSTNKAFNKTYGYELNEIVGRSLNFLHSGEHDVNFYKNVWNELLKYGIYKGKFVNKTKDGEKISVWSTIKQITNDKGQVVNYSAVQTDLRELESSQEKTDYLAYHDVLTGLYNRVSFEEYLTRAIASSRRNNTIFAVFFIDLDRFKIINDTLGHDVGDEVLKTVAKRLKKTLRESDFISRWGGDEFVVILENLTSVSDTAIIASNVIESLRKPVEVDEHSLTSTASVGIALYPENGKDSSELIKHADSAMYFAKETGKNNFRYYTKELSEDIRRKLKIDLALRIALKDNEFHMVFQPQYKLASKTIHSIEALIRWENATLGNVPPDEFIPIAEENGTIVKIGHFVFEESCKAFKKIQAANANVEYVAINVSSLQFNEPNLLETFLAIANRCGVEPKEIEIEITERFIMDHATAKLNTLQNFRNYGFKISIDDFGTGYSSMSYLKRLPIDTIKIDKSFVDDIEFGSPDNIIIEAIIALSKALGYQIVAEGVETQEQEDFLTQVKCDIGQGYLFSRPIKCEEIIQKYSKS